MGDEERVVDCGGMLSSICTHAQDTGVICQGAREL